MIPSIDIAFSRFPVLKTERLILRKILFSDETEIFSIYSDPEAMRHFGKHPFKTKVEAAGMIYKVVNAFQNKEGIRWGIAFKDTEKLIGSAGIWRLDMRHSRGEIGYELLPKHWGLGIMSEALKEILDFGFDKMGLHSMEANIDPENIASAKLLEKIGFRKEGYLRESYFFNNKFFDNVIYSLLDEERIYRKPSTKEE